MSLSKDLQEFTSAFGSSYKMFSDAEEKRQSREDLKAYRERSLDLNEEKIRGASKDELAGADAITRKYQTGTGTPGGGEEGSTRVPSTKQQDALAAQYHGYLVDKLGYSPQAAAGILGNMKQESSFNPLAAGDKGSAHGLFQWRGDRFANLQNFAAQQGKSWKDPYTQLDFMHQELTKGGYGKAYQALQGAKTAAQAADGFALHFERPKGANTGDPNQIHGIGARRGYANQVLGFRQDVAARPRTEPAVTSTALPPPAAAVVPARRKPEEQPVTDPALKLEPVAYNEPDEEEETGEVSTGFAAAGGAIPDPSGNFGAPRGYTQQPAQAPASVGAGAAPVGGGGGFTARRVGQAPAYRQGAGAIPMPAGVGYGVGQTTPGVQALHDRRAAKDAAAAAAAAAAAKPAALPSGNQWEGRYGQNPAQPGQSFKPQIAGSQQMTTESFEAMPDSAFQSNPQGLAQTYPQAANYIRWRAGEDAWARGAQQQAQYNRGGRESGYAQGGLVKSYADGGSVEDDEYETGYMEGEPPAAIPPPSQDRDVAREALEAPTPKEKTEAKTEVRRGTHAQKVALKEERDADDAEAAKKRMMERAKHREELLKQQAKQPEPGSVKDLPPAGDVDTSKPTKGTGVRGAVDSGKSSAALDRLGIVGSEGEPGLTVSPTGPEPEAAIPDQAPGAYGGRQGAPRGANVGPVTPGQTVPSVDELGNPLPVQDLTPGQPRSLGPPARLSLPATDSEGNPIVAPALAPSQAAAQPQLPAPAAITRAAQDGTAGPPIPPTRAAPSMAAPLPAPVGTPAIPPPGAAPPVLPKTDSEGNPIEGPSLTAPGAPPGPVRKAAEAAGVPTTAGPKPATPDQVKKAVPVSPQPVPGKPSPSQKAINPEGSDNPAGTAVTRGMKKANADEQKKQGAVPDPNAAPDYGKGGHVMTHKDYTDVERTVDPQRRMTDGDRNIAMYRELEDYWLSKGRPDKAAEASLGLTMYNRRAAQSSGGMALAALDKGDVVNAARWLSKGFNYVPNNQSLHVSPDKDGQGIEYRILDNRTGKEIEVGHADRGQLAAMAQGVMSGKEFDQQIWGILGKGKGGAAGPKGPSEGDKKAADKEEFESTRQAAVAAGKGIKDDPEKQKEFDEKISRLRSIGGHDPATIKAITAVYQEAGIELPAWLKTETKKGGKEEGPPIDEKALSTARVAADKARDALKENPDDPDLKRDYNAKASALAALFPPKIRDVRMKSAGHDPKGYQTTAPAPELPKEFLEQIKAKGGTTPVWDGEMFRFTDKDGNVKRVRPPAQ